MKIIELLNGKFQRFYYKKQARLTGLFFSESNKTIVSSDGTRINSKLKCYFYNCIKKAGHISVNCKQAPRFERGLRPFFSLHYDSIDASKKHPIMQKLKFFGRFAVLK